MQLWKSLLAAVVLAVAAHPFWCNGDCDSGSMTETDAEKDAAGATEVIAELRERNLGCDSCLVSCLENELEESGPPSEKCEAEIEKWKQTQLCRARRRKTQVFFRHVHKAGGSWFCNAFARKNMVVADNPNCVPGRIRDFCMLQWLGLEDQVGLGTKFSELEFLSMESPLPDNWAWWPYAWVTMLRNPSDRTLSAFYWWCDALNEQSRLFDKINGTTYKMDLCENYKAPFPKRNSPNENKIKYFDSWIEAYPDNQMVRSFCGAGTYQVPHGELTEKHLDCAKRRLDRFAIVLILERVQESTEVMRALLNWENLDIESGEGRNLRKKIQKPSDAESELMAFPGYYELVKKYNQLDQQLYEYANQILDDLVIQSNSTSQ